MRVISLRLAILAGGTLALVAGCARPVGEYQPYDQLQSAAADSAPTSPPDPSIAADSSPTEAAGNGERGPGNEPSPEADVDVVAVAELPVRFLMDREPAVAGSESDARVAEAELPETVVTVAASPRKVELLVPHKEFRRKAGALQITYDDIDLLKVLNMDPVPPDAPKLFPSWLKGLDGQKVRVRGFMYPAYSDELTKFVLARDNQICCFGRNPKIYDLIEVWMQPGETTRYIEGRPFDVVGVFRIKPNGSDDKLLELYFIEDAAVIER